MTFFSLEGLLVFMFRNNKKEVTSQIAEISLCGQAWRLFRLSPAHLPHPLQVQRVHRRIQPSSSSTQIEHNVMVYLIYCFPYIRCKLTTRWRYFETSLPHFLNLLQSHLNGLKTDS